MVINDWAKAIRCTRMADGLTNMRSEVNDVFHPKARVVRRLGHLNNDPRIMKVRILLDLSSNVEDKGKCWICLMRRILLPGLGCG